MHTHALTPSPSHCCRMEFERELIAKVMREEEQQAAFVAKEAKKNIVERQLGRLAPSEVRACVCVCVCA